MRAAVLLVFILAMGVVVAAGAQAAHLIAFTGVPLGIAFMLVTAIVVNSRRAGA